MPKSSEMCKIVEDYIRRNNITGKMPGIIALSRELGLNQVTLCKAYHMLAEKGVITICGTSGSFVNDRAGRSSGSIPGRKKLHHSIGVIGLNEDSAADQKRRMTALSELGRTRGFDVVNMGLSLPQLEDNHNMLGNFPVDGYIFYNSRLTTPHCRFLERTDIPFVNTGTLDGVKINNVVDHDHDTGYSIALKHLLDLGHRRIGYVNVKVRSELTDHDRDIRQVFRRMLGNDFDPALFYRTLENRDLRQMGSRAFDIYGNMALKHLFDREQPPTAVITMPSIAKVFIRLLSAAGIRCPQDVSVIAVTGDPPVDNMTCLCYDNDELLLLALHRLLDLIRKTDRNEFSEALAPQLAAPEATTAPPGDTKMIYEKFQDFLKKSGLKIRI